VIRVGEELLEWIIIFGVLEHTPSSRPNIPEPRRQRRCLGSFGDGDLRLRRAQCYVRNLRNNMYFADQL
jgi:hypothetical protein